MHLKMISPYWRYSAVRDSRTRPSHRILHGRIFKTGDYDYYPPIAFNCRCNAIPMTQNGYQDYITRYPENKKILDGKNKNIQKAIGVSNTAFVGKREDNYLKWVAQKYKHLSKDSQKLIDKAGELYSFILPIPIKQIKNVADRILKSVGRRTITPEQIKQQRKEIRLWAKTNIVGKEFKTSDGKTIILSNRDVKDIINEPHRQYFNKNNLPYDIENILAKSKLIKSAPEGKGRVRYKHWYYCRYKKGFYINVVKLQNGRFVVHSIKEKVL